MISKIENLFNEHNARIVFDHDSDNIEIDDGDDDDDDKIDRIAKDSEVNEAKSYIKKKYYSKK